MILIVDDDPSIREVVRFTLESGGYRVIEARDGAEALKTFSERDVELIGVELHVCVGSQARRICLDVWPPGEDRFRRRAT